MKAGTVIKLPDGKVGTICWHHLDGYGGVFGKHEIKQQRESFSSYYPKPEFMLRSKDVQHLFPDMECVGEEYEIIEEAQ